MTIMTRRPDADTMLFLPAFKMTKRHSIFTPKPLSGAYMKDGHQGDRLSSFCFFFSFLSFHFFCFCLRLLSRNKGHKVELVGDTAVVIAQDPIPNGGPSLYCTTCNVVVFAFLRSLLDMLPFSHYLVLCHANMQCGQIHSLTRCVWRNFRVLGV